MYLRYYLNEKNERVYTFSVSNILNIIFFPYYSSMTPMKTQQSVLTQVSLNKQLHIKY